MEFDPAWLGWFRQSHFALAFYLLSPERRQALKTLYAVCRLLDDVVDKKDPKAREILEAWKNFFINRDKSPLAPFGHGDIAAGMETILKMYDIPQFALLDLIDKGIAVDLGKNRFDTPMDTESYCYGVAGTVGVACLPIFGVPWQEAKEFAVRLGITVQWVNIIRDVGTDAHMNRIYLPLEHLEKFGVREVDILNGLGSDAMEELLRSEAQIARAHHRRAMELMPKKWEKELMPARLMGDIYLKLLVKLEKQAYPVLARQVRLNLLEKCWVAWKTMRN